MTVKISWVGRNTDILMLIWSVVYGIGFTVAKLAKIELVTEFVKKVSYTT